MKQNFTHFVFNTMFLVLSVFAYSSVTAQNADFSVNTSAQCLTGNSFVFTNLSSGSGNTYAWDFGDGTNSAIASPTKVYSAAGTYNVQLISTNSGISYYASKQVIVYAVPVPSFYYIIGSQNGASYTFISTSTIASGNMSYYWTFGDGSSSTLANPVKSYSVAGTYNVKLIVTGDGGCVDSISQSVVVTLVAISSSFTVNSSSQCLTGNSFTFTNTSTSGLGITYLWNFGDGATSTSASPSHTYTTAGTFTVSLAVTSGSVTENNTTSVVVKVSPTATFTTSNISNAYTFTSTCSNASSMAWNLGDGSTSTASSLTHIYAAGTYNVKLVATAASGCLDSITQVTVVSAPSTPPTSSYTINSSTQCFNGNSFVFSNTSSSGVGITYLWDFGDGATSSSTSPSHSYTATGTYSVTLTVFSSGGSTVSSQSVTVNASPSVSFTSSNTLANYTFTNGSSISSGTNSYAWNFGDGGTSTTVSPSHIFAAGTYSVKLVATSNNGCADSVSHSITLAAAPTAAFSVTSASTQCKAGNSYTFSNTSSGSGITYSWDFGDGSSTSSLTTPTHSYNAAGSYTITLTATNSGGSTSTTQSVTVNASPIVSFSSSVLVNDVTFTNGTTGAISYAWSFGDGGTSTNTSPIHTYANGSYTAKLVATSSLGCSDSLSQSVFVGTAPTAAFSITSPTTQCSNHAFTFSNTTSGSGVSYLWNFGDGSNSTTTNPSHTYTAGGTYTVTLTASNGSGSSTATDTVIVNSAPTVDFNIYSNSSSGNSYTFVSTSTIGSGTMTYAWDLGNGTTSTLINPSVTYASPGTYSITLVVTASSGGCSGTVTKSVTYCPTITPNFSVTSSTSQCTNINSFTFANSSTNSAGISPALMSYVWYFGDGTTSSLQTPPAHVYASWGDYDIKLVVTLVSGTCTITDSITRLKVVSAEPLPSASYGLYLDAFLVSVSPELRRCFHPGYDFSYRSNSTLPRGQMHYKWSFGTSAVQYREGDSLDYINPRIIFDTAGTYPVKLRVSSDKGCLDSITWVVKLSDPHALFNYTVDFGGDVYANPTVSVAEYSHDYGAILTNWNWNFGNSTTSILQNPPSYHYTCGGNYTLSLNVVSEVPCSDDTSAIVVIQIRPKAIFSISAPNYTPDVYARPTYTFTNSTTVNDACPSLSYAWSFGDGYTSALANPTHIFKGSGTYSVRLIATNGNGGKKDTTFQSVTVSIKPKALFSTSQSYTPNVYAAPTVTYTNSTSSTDTAAPPASLTYAWDFGDGATSALRNPPTHVYTSGGTYNVTLTVTNPISGLSDVISHNVIIKIRPQSAFTIGAAVYSPDVYAQPSFTFTNTTTVNDLAASLSYDWRFGDGATSTAVSPSHTYTSGGTYADTLITTNANGGLKDTVIHNVVVAIRPIAAFTVGAAVYSPNVYTQPSFTFTNTSSSNDGAAALTYAWRFGDGATSTAVSPSHTYTSGGTYADTLIVTNTNGGLKDTVIHNLVVAIRPIAAFTVGAAVYSPNVYAQPSFTFTNTSSSNDGAAALTYDWRFGDGATSTGASPSHTYTSGGTYADTLIVTNTNGGLKDTVIHNVVVAIRPIAAFTVGAAVYSPDVYAQPNYTFTNTSSSNDGAASLSYAWTFGDGGTSTGTSPNHTYTSGGTYTVTLITTNGNGGLKDTVTHTVTASIRPIAAFTVGAAVYSPNVYAQPSFTFTNTSSSNDGAASLSYDWRFGDGATSTAISPSHTYTSGGTYADTLITTNANGGLKDTVIHNVVVAIRPTAAFTVGAAVYSPNVYAQPSFTFTNTSSSNDGAAALTYAWRFGDGATSTAVSPSHTYTSGGTYADTLIVTNTNGGLKDTVIHNVVVAIRPIAAFTVGAAVYSPDVYAQPNYTFTNTSSSNDGAASLSYAWTFGDGGTSTGTSPNHTYTSGGTYTVTLITTNGNGGLKDTITHTVTVSIRPTAAFTVGAAVYSPNVYAQPSFTFTNTSSSNDGAAALSYDWRFGDGATSTATSPSHTYTSGGTYADTLIVTNANGGLKDTVIHNVVVAIRPTAAFTVGTAVYAPDVYAQPDYTFTNASSSNDGAASLTYAWDFGDGATSTSTSPSHIYTSGGTFTVTLITTNTNGGLKDTVTHNITAVIKPQAGFSSNVNYHGDTYSIPLVEFTNTTASHDGAGSLSYVWDFGDGTATVTPAGDTSHTYATGGTFTVTLITTNANGGLKDTISHNVHVVITPKASINVTTFLNGGGDSTYVDFWSDNASAPAVNSSIVLGSIASYDWAFDLYQISTNTNYPNYATSNNYETAIAIANAELTDWQITAHLTATSDLGIADNADAVYLSGTSGSGYTAFRMGTTGNPITIISTPIKIVALELYPNPAHDNLVVSFTPKSDNTTLAVYSLSGNLVKQVNISTIANKITKTSINVSNLAVGTYTVVVLDKSGKRIGATKVIKSKS